jgi:hypothetical protein
VWVHLVGLCLVLERRFPVDAAVRAIARLASQGFDHGQEFPWLEPPADRGLVTVIDIVTAADADAHVREMKRWADSAWGAWKEHHPAIRRRAEALVDSS